MGCTGEQIIGDVLDQYEIHLSFLRGQENIDGPSTIAEATVPKTDWDADFENPATEAATPKSTETTREGSLS